MLCHNWRLGVQPPMRFLSLQGNVVDSTTCVLPVLHGRCYMFRCVKRVPGAGRVTTLYRGKARQAAVDSRVKAF